VGNVPNERGHTHKEIRMNPIRKVAVGAAMLGATLTGGAIGATFLGTASAQTDTSSSSTATAPTDSSSTAPADAPAPRDPSKGGHTANGVTEELLAGDTATQVTEAAQAAVPDGTIERVETDADGATYEAHMVKADGSHVTVLFNADFSVSSIETGK
jgi:ABC-type transport system substrate-binding protein